MFFSWAFFFCFVILWQKADQFMFILITLEFLGLLLFALFSLEMGGVSHSSLNLLFFLVVVASESVLGLVLFVIQTRAVSKDFIGMLTVSKF